ncbi:MAG: hypothetical protein ABWY82_02765 [Tardiphaga sp.]
MSSASKALASAGALLSVPVIVIVVIIVVLLLFLVLVFILVLWSLNAIVFAFTSHEALGAVWFHLNEAAFLARCAFRIHRWLLADAFKYHLALGAGYGLALITRRVPLPARPPFVTGSFELRRFLAQPTTSSAPAEASRSQACPRQRSAGATFARPN